MCQRGRYRGSRTTMVFVAMAVATLVIEGAGGCSSFGVAAKSPEDSAAGGDPADRVSLDADAAARSVCADAVPFALCDTFDEGKLGGSWTRSNTTNQGALLLGPSFAAASPPNAFIARAPADCANGTSAQLVFETAGHPREAKVDFLMSLGPMSPAGAAFAGITYTTAVPSGSYRIDLGFKEGRLQAFQNDNGTFSTLATAALAFASEVPHRISMAVTYGAAPNFLVNVDGETHLSTPITPAPPSQAPTTALELGLNLGAGCQAVASEARFDDVVYRLEMD